MGVGDPRSWGLKKSLLPKFVQSFWIFNTWVGFEQSLVLGDGCPILAAQVTCKA